MQTDELVQYLDDPRQAAPWLRKLGLVSAEHGHANLLAIADSGMTVDLLAEMCGQLERHLPEVSDPDMALNNLDRFVAATRSPLLLGSLFAQDDRTLPILLQLFSSSQYLADLLVNDPESFDLLRITEGQPVQRQTLIDEIVAEVDSLDNEVDMMRILRRFKRRETLRIAYGDIVRSQAVEAVAMQISHLADAICEAALHAAWKVQQRRRGTPRCGDGRPARFVVLALGKLGGNELNYSSDVDLIFLYETDGQTSGDKSVTNHEFFDRLGKTLVKLMTEPTELGIAYRVDLRLRPQGRQGPMVMALEPTLNYYDLSGRTWERQAFVKARPIAGDMDLGVEFLERMQPWIYRKYLTRADITGIKALKRRIEGRAQRNNGGGDVKTGHGGIRDIEFVIQFLQLLNGSESPEVRTGNTFEAIRLLERAQCLTVREATILEENYCFLRKLEHRLQIMFDLQTHSLPEAAAEQRKLAIRMGYADDNGRSAREPFRTDFRLKTELNRGILDHLLHDAFGEDSQVDPEIDLVLDPDPSEATIAEVLGKYGFRDVEAAYRNLMDLSRERITFLSTRRCRHFLAAITPRLLAEIATTPDPDATLVDLTRVSDSLGGKGVLWELFSWNAASLKLYVRLCASSPYLTGTLTSNPGMIDELMDSLVLDKLPRRATLRTMLTDLCRGAEDIAPILHSFKNAQHLRVGVRDVLGKEDIRATHRTLSDVAEVCLQQVIDHEYTRLIGKYGEPTLGAGRPGDRVCQLLVLALGKLGGREPNYHSDLDIVFLYEGDGQTRRPHDTRRDETTTNQHFFSTLGARIIKVVNQMGPLGRLYELDARLRPTGKSGALAVSLSGLSRYFTGGSAQLWERQALCKARVVYGEGESAERLMRIVHAAIVDPPWRSENAEQIRQMRYRMQETAGARNLKRGLGGTVDVEFIVQMLQLRHAADTPQALLPGTFDALDALHAAGRLAGDDFELLSNSYRFLRNVEARLRLMNTTARHDMPTDDHELTKLAYLLGYADRPALVADATRFAAENRRTFDRLFDAAAR